MTKGKGVTIPTLTCLRCNHTWIPSKSRPRACPACKSYSWDSAPKDKDKGAAVAEKSVA